MKVTRQVDKQAELQAALFCKEIAICRIMDGDANLRPQSPLFSGDMDELFLLHDLSTKPN